MSTGGIAEQFLSLTGSSSARAACLPPVMVTHKKKHMQ